MFSVAHLRRRPRHFHRFTGLTPKEFDHLLAQCEPAYQEALRQQREGPQPRRAVGAGHPFALPVAERLLLGLMYRRLYVTQSLLACLFNLDESNICRELNERLLPLLLQVLPTPLRDAPLRDAPLRDAPLRDAPLRDAPLRDAPLAAGRQPPRSPAHDTPVEEATPPHPTRIRPASEPWRRCFVLTRS